MNLIVELIKYMMILLIGIYTYYSFNVFRFKNKKLQNKIYLKLTIILFVLHFTGYFTLYFQHQSKELIYLYGAEVLLFILVLLLYQILYPKLSKLLLRNMLMLLAIGFIIQTRLSFDNAVKQVMIIGGSFLISLIVPFLIHKLRKIKNYGWIYGVVGILLLLVVLILGKASHGATNWLQIAGISVQPSEFVKLLFVFSIAGLLSKRTDFIYICIISVLAGVTVIILVVQRDLGGALIFFITYMFMLYAATGRSLYLFSGLIGGSLAAVMAYRLFDHVKVRVLAWKNPFAYIDKEGYQITQSLFAIGTGGWFGMGLNRGLPTNIPVVDSDFIFSAISEEMGGVIAICIILIFASCFVMFLNIALEQEDIFYRLLAIGFAVMFAFQVILSIGGVIKFIPSTGVTLPLISMGGSSALSVVVMFMILQGVSVVGRTKQKLAVASEQLGGYE